MIFSYRNLVFIFSVLLFSACSESEFVYKAQPVDIKVSEKNGTFEVEGSSVFQLPDTFVWGGSPIQINQKYYLFFSAWESGPDVPPFSKSWVLNSKIGVAVSDSPYGNFKSLGIFLKGRELQGESTAWDAQMVHNPLIKSFNGKYYLYHIGSRDPGKRKDGEPGSKLSKRNRVQQNQKIGLIEFESVEELLDGSFQRSKTPLLAPRTRVKPDNVINPSAEGTVAKPDNLIVVNPAVVQRPSDGKYLLFFKGNIYDPGWRGVHGLAIGDNPAGPFETTDQFVFDVDDGTGEKVSAEDPYVWYHRKDVCFYAVVKDFTGKLTRSEPGLALLKSEEGLEWSPAENPLFMKKELLLKDGTILKVDRLERPQLLLDENDDPKVLFAACSIDPANNKQDGGTFNVQIPIIKVKK
jgi:hypothetical protein